MIQASDRPGIEGTVLGADGTAAEILLVPAGGSREPASAETVAASRHAIQMPNGREVFKRAVTEMAASCREVLEKNGTLPDDVDLLIPHQANARIMVAVAERLAIPLRAGGRRRRRESGNTSAASIPIALDRAYQRRPHPRGRPGAVHVVRRRTHVGRHGDALDDARDHVVTAKIAVVTGGSRADRPRVRGRARRRPAGPSRSDTDRARKTRRRRSRR